MAIFNKPVRAYQRAGGTTRCFFEEDLQECFNGLGNIINMPYDRHYWV